MGCDVSGRKNTLPAMLALTDAQLQTVMATAAEIDPDRRGIFLERVGMMLKLKGRFNDADVGDTAKLAACGLVHGLPTP